MKYFGTDGIRGGVNKGNIRADFFVKLGYVVGYLIYSKYTKNNPNSGRKPIVIIGKDTRLSGYMIESSLMAGLVSTGVDVMLTGPISTPAISVLTKSMRADGALMITASHNHFYDNGVKVFNEKGEKATAQEEGEIEELLGDEPSKFFVESHLFGKARRIENVDGRCVEFVKGQFRGLNLRGMKIAIDPANGGAYKIAPAIFWELGAEVFCKFNEPDGTNINHFCGSNHPEVISQMVVEKTADIGISLDGDADRICICDENGKQINCHHIMALIALDMNKKGELGCNKVVSTILANTGFEDFLQQHNIDLVKVAVGDKNVYYKLVELGCNFGGEPSGHLILPQFCKTGDGVLTALKFISILHEQKMKASAVHQMFNLTPYVELNIALNGKKINFAAVDAAVEIKIAKIKSQMSEENLSRCETFRPKFATGECNLGGFNGTSLRAPNHISDLGEKSQIADGNLGGGNKVFKCGQVLGEKSATDKDNLGGGKFLGGGVNIIVRKSGTEDKLRIVVNANLPLAHLQTIATTLQNIALTDS